MLGCLMPAPRHKLQGSAAFYDVDGTLIRAHVVNALRFYAMNQPTLTGSLVKSISTLAQLPLYWAADKISRKAFNEMFYKVYEGQSEDRLVVLAEDMFEDVIKK